MKFDSVETAAERPVYLASSREVAGITGKYFDSNKKMADTSSASHDEALSRHVWEMSSELVGLAGKELAQLQTRST